MLKLESGFSWAKNFEIKYKSEITISEGHTTTRYTFNVLIFHALLVLLLSLGSMAFAREYLVPNYYQEQVDGNISGDPMLYRQLALDKKEEIKKNGFSAFELRPRGQGPAGIVSLLFLICENDYSFVFLNAFLLTVATVFMVQFLHVWFPLKTSIVASLPLCISPYMFVWFSQLNKDSFVLTGEILIIYGVSLFIRKSGGKFNRIQLAGYITAIVAGAMITSISRPYVNQINIVATLPLLLSIFILRIAQRKSCVQLIVFFTAAIFTVSTFYLCSRGGASGTTLGRLYDSSPEDIMSLAGDVKTPGVTADCLVNMVNWEKAPWMPSVVDKKLKAMVGHRCLMFSVLQTHSNTATLNSFVDKGILPNSTLSSLFYIPRGAQIGIFSPFPNQWLYNLKHPRSFFYTVVPFETLLLYVGLVGLAVWVSLFREWLALIPIFLSCIPIVIYGTSVPFIGALHRFRYPWCMVLTCLGFAATITLLLSLKNNFSRTALDRSPVH